MMRSLFTAATGMESQQITIDTISNNLANVNTTAFKRSRANFHDLLYQTLRAPGQSSTAGTVVPSGIQIGAGSKVSSVEKMFNEGAIRITNKPTDLMIEGEGFFRIQKDDGSIAYTRDGSFRIDNTGRIVTSDGFPLVPVITVPERVPHNKIHIGMDGNVSARIADQTEELGQILLANFVNPTGLDAQGRNLFGATPASGAPIVAEPNTQGFGRIGQGELEGSNVNIVEEMVNMISGQRAYEINSKVIQTGDQMLQQTNNIR
ncbi:flagellar basal-body rod protein FlgG [Pseudobacteriovorax antillogorgiicola]|uniref:Flagellar basal-body rod protein FlgG n=1 Tax=Pseudobacteriovorax antillogorgiicola TaxID=1513793 RepID=A0A1Y6B374_9BACT|nr:flagellar basal-body rod protein FlgG [Pseudobacteriovorax antillogorgiicola]TCS59525.1 flagellar basal-body rod protein FlgG [Pseudobacteriovorax antillogorgiicola]SME87841.1 flagellar basal-body rod protein FlgG [Pseudobacteriovorax antillogorgiicola]